MFFREIASFYLANSLHRSKARDQFSLNRLAPYFQDKVVGSIKRTDVRAYIRARQAKGVTLSTVRRELRFASAAVNFAAVELELDIRNPFQSLNIPEAEPRCRWLTRDQADRLVKSAALHAKTPALPCFIVLALNTGCRRGELLGLEWSRVDMTRSLFYLDAAHTKTAKRRSVPLNADSLGALRELLQWRAREYPGSPWVFPSASGGHVRWLKTAFRNSCQRAGIADFRIHDLRHTCASWLVMAGVDLYTVRDLLGHTSIATTERYAHLAPDRLSAAVAKLEK